MATTVIIPARNEEATIGSICEIFYTYPNEDFDVYVGIDADTTDNTGKEAAAHMAYPVRTTVRGKGQVVWQTLIAAHTMTGISDRVILCDADYTGFTWNHINRIMTKHRRGMVLGVPDWPDCEVPNHVTEAWPRVTGFRCLPWTLLTREMHGYLIETQLNQRAAKLYVPARMVMMPGLKSPFTWPLSEQRNAERKRDQEWGERNGVL